MQAKRRIPAGYHPSSVPRVSSTSKTPGLMTMAFGLALLIVLAASWVTDPAHAACNRGAVNCVHNTAMTMRTCSATLMCSSPNVTPMWQVQSFGALNVTSCAPPAAILSGSPATTTLVAKAPTTAPTNRLCSWRALTLSSNFLSGTPSITSADGLPVELMEFSVDGEQELVPGEAAAEPEAPSE